VESSVPDIGRSLAGTRQVGSCFGAGALVGLSAALLEWWANHLAGGLLPGSGLVDLAALFTAAGAFLGMGVGLARRLSPPAARCGSSPVGVAVTVLAFNALWVFSFQGPRRGLLFLIGAPIYFWAACRLGALLVDRDQPLLALQRSLLAVTSMVFGTLAAELLLDASWLREASMLAGMLLLPPLSVVLHEACLRAFRLRAAKSRAGLSAAVALFVAFLIASPSLLLSERTHFDPLVTSVVSSESPSGLDSRSSTRIEAASSPDHLAAAPDEERGRPSILVISLDTTRADHMSVYGYGRDTTPNLVELARDSLVFSNCVSTSTWTLPSHASLFTGLHPRTHGATLAGSRTVDVDPASAPPVELDKVGVAHPLAAGHETLAEILSGSGYATAAIVANHSYLYRYFGLSQGFRYYDDSPAMLLRRRSSSIRLGRAISRDFLRRKYRSAEDITDEAIRWLDSVDGQPFLLFVNFMEPHAPLVIAEDDRLHSSARGREKWRPWLLEDVEYTRRPGAWSSHDSRVYSAMYDDAIRSMDAEIGRLIADLSQRGAYDDLMVVVFGDHGELLGEHGLVGHIGRAPYEGLVKVPLLIKYPGGAKKGDWQAPVQTLDVFPTILDAVGIEPGDGVQGQVLPDVSHEIVVEQFVHPPLAEADPEAFDRETRALYRGGYKLIATSRGELELYDLETDPTETTDLSTDLPDVVHALRAALIGWEKATPFYTRLEDEIPSEQVLERLKSLGYIE
jgi:arylsulfatase A-like enzyme